MYDTIGAARPGGNVFCHQSLYLLARGKHIPFVRKQKTPIIHGLLIDVCLNVRCAFCMSLECSNIHVFHSCSCFSCSSVLGRRGRADTLKCPSVDSVRRLRVASVRCRRRRLPSVRPSIRPLDRRCRPSVVVVPPRPLVFDLFC